MNKQHVANVTSAYAIGVDLLGIGEQLILHAQGTVPTSGWNNIRLARRFSSAQPTDGVIEFDFVGEAPNGMVLNVMTPVHAEGIFSLPGWAHQIKIFGRNGHIVVNIIRSNDDVDVVANNIAPTTINATSTVYSRVIASYEDSWQLTGKGCGGFSVEMKKLYHSLKLEVTGPDENAIKHCIEQSAVIGLIAAIVATYATGGGGFSAATSAFLAHLENCLGDQYSVTLDDDSKWVYYCT